MDSQKVDAEYELLKGDFNLVRLEKVARTSRYLSIVFIPVLFFLFVYGGYKLKTLRQELFQLESLKQQSLAERQAIEQEIAALEKKKRIAEADLIKAYGYSPAWSDQVKNDQAASAAIAANSAIKKITKADGVKPKDIQVYYYNKTIDEKKIALGLEALGYQFNALPATAYMDKKQTNAIWFGSDVPLADVKVVAFALIRAVIQIKAIRPYKKSAENPGYKNNRIEVGASVDVEALPGLTVDQVVSASEFLR